ncbi:JmjC domain-containing protein [Tsuneonella sp. HG222]
MTAINNTLGGIALDAFPPATRARFAANYPEVTHVLQHGLREHPLLAIEALAQLGEALPDASVEYNRGNLPIGVDGKPGSNGLTIGETIRTIATSGSWAVLKNIEQHPAYAALLAGLLGEIESEIVARTGRMLKTQGFIFVSSPDAVTPYHFDPEHNILLQLQGTKTMTVYPAGDARFSPNRVHEQYHTGGARELRWSDDFLGLGTPFDLNPGDAIFVPVMSPHYVKNGPAVSISLSITWRSDWSFAEADAWAFNKWLRARGFEPRRTGRWPRTNKAKAYAWRVLRRLGARE